MIILIEREEGRARRVVAALEAEGWVVETRSTLAEAAQLAQSSTPDLIVAGSSGEAEATVRRFSARSGGPGVVVLGPEIAGADGQVDPSGSDEEIRIGVRRVLSGLSRKAVERAAAEAASSGGQFTSEDIFGDMLAEVESEVVGAEPPSLPPPVAASGRETAAPASARTVASDRASRSSDLDRKLEQTLSGVLDPPRRRKKAARRDAGGELDALISQTLSGVVSSASSTPSGSKVPSVSPPKAEAPALETLPDPVLEPPKRVPTPRVKKKKPSAAAQVDALVDGLTSTRSAPRAPRPKPPAVSRPESSLVAPKPADSGAAKPSVPTPAASTPGLADLSSSDVYSTMRMPIVKLPEGPPGLPSVEIPTMVAKPGGTPIDPVGGAPTEVLDQRAVRDAVEASLESSSTTDAESEKKQFGQYTLLDRVAVGGMAEVWKARMQGVEGFQKNVAIKRILPHLTDSSDFLTMFIDEAKLAAQLNHPNIVHIYDLGKIEEDYYIAMEYIAGKDLRSILNDGREAGKPLPLGLAVLIGSRLASGLDHAHRKRDFDNRELGLVHRDVSPQNVLVSFDGDIKLCDFGIAKAVAKASKTQMGALKGKLQYMSPEQAWGRVVDARSDIFSLGAVLFEMLTGERLFSGASEISVLESVREGRVRAVREIAGQVSPELDRVVAKALAKDPDDRYQTAGEMQQDLEAILYSLKPTPVEATLTDYMRSVYGDEAVGPEDSQELVAPTLEPAAAGGSEEQPVPAIAPKAGRVVEDGSDRSMGLWLGLAAAVLVIVGVLWFALGSRSSKESSGEPPASPAQATEALETASAVPAGQGLDDALDSEADAEDGLATDGEPVEGTTATEAAEDAGIEALVEEQVRDRDAALEAERQALERQVEEARLKAAQAEEAAAAAAAAEEEVPTEPEVADPVEATPSGDAADEGAAADEAVEPEPTASDVEATPPPVATPEPKPEPEPEPAAEVEKAPEPEPPRFTTGQMVEAGTPGLVAPRMLSIKPPDYPPMARRMKVSGTVVVGVLVDETGAVQQTKIVQGVRQNVGLNEAAERAAEGARFQPATIEGVRVKTWFNLSIPFRL